MVRKEQKGERVRMITKVIRRVRECGMLPCVVFSLSREECELHSHSIKSMDLSSGNSPILIAHPPNFKTRRRRQ